MGTGEGLQEERADVGKELLGVGNGLFDMLLLYGGDNWPIPNLFSGAFVLPTIAWRELTAGGGWPTLGW